MAKIRFKTRSDFGRAIETSFKQVQSPITDAAIGALDEARKAAVAQGRQSIRAAQGNFKGGWVTGLTSRLYRNTGLDAAALVYHKIKIAGVFEFGATHVGRPLMWLPIGNERGKKDLRGRNLAFVGRTGRAPLMVGDVGGERVPLLVGIPVVKIRKRFHIIEIIRSAAERLGEFYDKRFRAP